MEIDKRQEYGPIKALICGIIFALCLSYGGPGARAEPAFERGWELKADNSTLAFQSVKNEKVVESSTFAAVSGGIDPDGTAKLVIQLDSVDTKVDLRNVRMRFLFFETFRFPTATVTAQLDPAAFADLPVLRRKVMPLTFTLDLHGEARELTAQVAVVLITDDLVSVSAVAPVSVGVEEFGLLPGLKKLEEAANVKVLPSGSVTFDLLFARNPGSGLTAPPKPEAPATAPPAAAALETKGDFSAEECAGRFEILSRSRSITFRAGSAGLDPASNDFLNALYDIVSRCPGMVVEVGGHTDADGSASANQQLSERRAAAVAAYLVEKGIPAPRLQVKGYGEEHPIAANDSAEGKAKNRRIEFKITG